jgi:dipeptide/tripeptide permease
MAHSETPAPSPAVQQFPTSFWTANVTELFERAAYYSMASFVVIYLGQLGFGSYWPSFLSSSVLWFLVFFLPILSGTIADQIGFRRALLIAFVLLAVGYFFMGYPVWLGGSELTATISDEVSVGRRDAVMIVGAILLIGIGGSVIKPCISGTVQKVSGARATLGFAIFYMVINIGSLFGRGTAFVVRNGAGVGTILTVVAVLAAAAAGIVLLVQRTTKADRSRSDVWLATGGFTLIVVVSAALVAGIYSATAAERVGTGTSSLSYIFAVAAMASLVAFFVVLFTYQEPARSVAAPTAAAVAASGSRRGGIPHVLGRLVLMLVINGALTAAYRYVFLVWLAPVPSFVTVPVGVLLGLVEVYVIYRLLLHDTKVGRILANMVLVLRSGRFTLYLVVMSGFYFIYNQVYNVLPLYVKKVVETSPAMDLYTAANPFVIVCFQLILSRSFGKMKPIRSMVVGTVIIAIAMLINVLPIYLAGGPQAVMANWLPLGSVFIILTVALIALGELFTSPRMYEYIGALAPKGQEGLFLGYANLPLAIGAWFGGPVGAFIFNEIMARGATKRPDGLLELVPTQNMLGWVILMAIGFASAASLWLFNRWLERQTKATA